MFGYLGLARLLSRRLRYIVCSLGGLTHVSLHAFPGSWRRAGKVAGFGELFPSGVLSTLFFSRATAFSTTQVRMFGPREPVAAFQGSLRTKTKSFWIRSQKVLLNQTENLLPENLFPLESLTFIFPA